MNIQPHIYLFTLEIVPLEVGMVYVDLPSHLTLMSRFNSERDHETMAQLVEPIFDVHAPISLTFGTTERLGPKQVLVHHVEDNAAEYALHNDLMKTLQDIGASSQYPEYTGKNHIPHVSARPDVNFASGQKIISHAAYLIEIVDKKRVVRRKFMLKS